MARYLLDKDLFVETDDYLVKIIDYVLQSVKDRQEKEGSFFQLTRNDFLLFEDRVKKMNEQDLKKNFAYHDDAYYQKLNDDYLQKLTDMNISFTAHDKGFSVTSFKYGLSFYSNLFSRISKLHANREESLEKELFREKEKEILKQIESERNDEKEISIERGDDFERE